MQRQRFFFLCKVTITAFLCKVFHQLSFSLLQLQLSRSTQTLNIPCSDSQQQLSSLHWFFNPALVPQLGIHRSCLTSRRPSRCYCELYLAICPSIPVMLFFDELGTSGSIPTLLFSHTMFEIIIDTKNYFYFHLT